MGYLFAATLLAAGFSYGLGVLTVRRRGGWWPARHSASWAAGLAAAAAATTGPLAGAAHHDFTAHMTGHLLLGMAAPLLLVLAAPVTLALRALPAPHARTLSRALRSRPVRVVTHPVTAALLDAGGLWLLYTTDLYPAMARHPWLHVAVHVHIVAAGYLLSAALIGIDPDPHRAGRRTRAVVLVAFLAAHGILAKYLYGHPPAGVLPGAGRTGAELMYYGGDLIDLALIVAFCRQWYAAADPTRRDRNRTPRIPAVPPARVPWRLPAEFRAGPGTDPGSAAVTGLSSAELRS
ncbi:cytochrome c oxidase assembly protein [Actinoplanes oblitus]|uniref:Cytochrome c oxidase assembly protein n=1 Tax=Actinoplanes oblitus TaxID=3040509 RepID=A0ABY8WU80_9ACTN|nr:cytochrome c oxidase assembly protein [Actinoplanes oblitus]WIN00229.1 cytochrome c oxidase assembly protein [Actinoplanes oblitus]